MKGKTLKCGHRTNQMKVVGIPKKTLKGISTPFHCRACGAKYNKIVLGKDILWMRVA